MDFRSKIKEILGRVPEIVPISYKGKKGYLPVYFNYDLKDRVIVLFSETEDGAYQNLYDFLTKSGDHNGSKTNGE